MKLKSRYRPFISPIYANYGVIPWFGLAIFRMNESCSLPIIKSRLFVLALGQFGIGFRIGVKISLEAKE